MRRRKRIELSLGEFLPLIDNTKSNSYFNADLSQPSDFGTVSVEKNDDYLLSKAAGLSTGLSPTIKPVDVDGEKKLLQFAANLLERAKQEK